MCRGELGAWLDDESSLVVMFAKCTKDERVDAARLELCSEGFCEVMGAVVVHKGGVQLFSAALVVAVDVPKFAIGCVAVLIGVREVVAVVVGIAVDTEGLDVKDFFHTPCARVVRVGREVVGEDVRDGGILAGVEAQ